MKRYPDIVRIGPSEGLSDGAVPGRVHRPLATYVQVGPYLPTLAGYEKVS